MIKIDKHKVYQSRGYQFKNFIIMKLTAPTNAVWGVAVGLGVLGILGKYAIAALAPYAFWLVFAGFIVLAVACLLKGL